MYKYGFVIMLVLLGVTQSDAFADIMAWDASSGIPPWDPSLPPEQRYIVSGDASFVAMAEGFLNFNDTSGPDSGSHAVGVEKNDLGSDPLDSPWAFELELRMNSHERPSFDWGAATGIRDGIRRGKLLIGRDAVGFAGFNGDSFINDEFAALNTTDDFHVYRVIKELGFVHLFIDTFDSPVLSLSYDDLLPDAGVQVVLANTSNGGIADFDVRRFALNPDGTDVPEPSTAFLLSIGGLYVARRRWRR